MSLIEALKEAIREDGLGNLVWLLGLYAFIFVISIPFRFPAEGWKALDPRPSARGPIEHRRPQSSKDVDWIDQMWVDDRREEVDGL